MARLTDEIVDEIHAVRLQHAALFDYDIERIVDDLRVSQEKRVTEGWLLVTRPDTPTESGDSALHMSRFSNLRQ